VIAIILTLALSTGLDPARAESAPAQEKCGFLVESGTGPSQFQLHPEFHLLGSTARLAHVAGVLGVMCGRDTLRLGAFDDRVVRDMQVPLTIAAADRLGVLEMSDGRFRFRMIQGALTEDEALQVNAQLNTFQSREAATPPSP
jgi:hypothetical protein